QPWRRSVSAGLAAARAFRQWGSTAPEPSSAWRGTRWRKIAKPRIRRSKPLSRQCSKNDQAARFPCLPNEEPAVKRTGFLRHEHCGCLASFTSEFALWANFAPIPRYSKPCAVCAGRTKARLAQLRRAAGRTYTKRIENFTI